MNRIMSEIEQRLFIKKIFACIYKLCIQHQNFEKSFLILIYSLFYLFKIIMTYRFKIIYLSNLEKFFFTFI